MKRLATLLGTLCLASAGACLPENEEQLPDAGDELGSTEQAVSGGEETPPGVFPAVGYVPYKCSGTLIADDLVLMAGHCFCPGISGASACPDVGPLYEFRLTGVDDFTTPQDETVAGAWVSFYGRASVHPDYEAGGIWPGDGLIDNDYAVFRLQQGVSTKVAGVSPMQISTSSPVVGQYHTMVGYGGDEPDPECNVQSGIKRHASTPLDYVDNQGKLGFDLIYLDDSIHTCGGDSGGPSLDPSGRIAGIASVGNRDSRSKHDGTYHAREWINQQITSPGNRLQIWNFGQNPAQQLYNDNNRDSNMFGFHDPEDLRLAGDFLNVGHDQVLYVNRGSGSGRFLITDLDDQMSPVEPLFYATYSESTAYAEFVDSPTDLQFVGDFLGRGYDQVLFLNRSGSGGRIRIADFSDGLAPAESAYYEAYTASVLLNGWHDSNDIIVTGDFRGSGRDQLLFINNAGSAGHVMVVDFGVSSSPATWPTDVAYHESYGASVLLSGWHDAGDHVIAGRFTHGGYDQVLFINNGAGAGRLLIVDFSVASPATWSNAVRFYEAWGWSSALNSWHDYGYDILLAGNFMADGHEQLLMVNRTAGGRFLVADFSDGASPVAVRFLQYQGASLPLEGRIDADDGLLAGDYLGIGRDQLLTIERYPM